MQRCVNKVDKKKTGSKKPVLENKYREVIS